MDISNKSLAFLLVAAMVLSLGGTILSLNKLGTIGATGMATGTDQGIANLSINGSTAVTFTVNSVEFGSGYTNDTDGNVGTVENCTIDTNGTNPSADNDCVGFNPNVPPFIIRNDGNQDSQLTISADKDSTAFFGSSNGGVYWFVEDNESNSCGTVNPATWTAISTGNIDACGGAAAFKYQDSTDSVKLHIKVDIPLDAPSGTKTTTITATSTV